MKRILYIIFSIFAFSLSARQADSLSVEISRPDSTFMAMDTAINRDYTQQSGDSLYAAEDYLTAIQVYETILKDRGESSTLYYNLGNAYYKSNDIARAILNYERALLMNPSDRDARFNLELAQSKTVDKVDVKSEFFVTVWIRSLINAMPVNGWAWMGIIAFIIMIISMLAFIFGKKMPLRKTGLTLTVITFVVVVFSNLFAHNLQNRLINRNSAVVMQPSVTVRSTPSTTGPELFIIHEGHKVQIVDDTMRGWKEIEIEDGNVGWLPVESIEII